jgi:hypothetical protein
MEVVGSIIAQLNTWIYHWLAAHRTATGASPPAPCYSAPLSLHVSIITAGSASLCVLSEDTFNHSDVDLVVILADWVDVPAFMNTFPLDVMRHRPACTCYAIGQSTIPIITISDLFGYSVDLLLVHMLPGELPALFDPLAPDAASYVHAPFTRQLASIKLCHQLVYIADDPAFYVVLRVVKLWAHRRCVLGSKYGFLSGASIAVLVASALAGTRGQRAPHRDSVVETLYHTFRWIVTNTCWPKHTRGAPCAMFRLLTRCHKSLLVPVHCDDDDVGPGDPVSAAIDLVAHRLFRAYHDAAPAQPSDGGGGAGRAKSDGMTIWTPVTGDRGGTTINTTTSSSYPHSIVVRAELIRAYQMVRGIKQMATGLRVENLWQPLHLSELSPTLCLVVFVHLPSTILDVGASSLNMISTMYQGLVASRIPCVMQQLESVGVCARPMHTGCVTRGADFVYGFALHPIADTHPTGGGVLDVTIAVNVLRRAVRRFLLRTLERSSPLYPYRYFLLENAMPTGDLVHTDDIASELRDTLDAPFRAWCRSNERCDASKGVNEC